ncbi:hypothetical protein [Paenibacillus sp. MBLB4367]|uniref:hypothetical protein n=1 Tax=Paenibacillus sp. MBLB4367 TaxID=3384767 RepID=UPI003908450D
MFLRDYGKYAKHLFDSAPLTKLPLEITEEKWTEYVQTMMNFMNLSYVDSPEAAFPSGRYFNAGLNQYVEIVQDRFMTPSGGDKQLIAKSANEFYLDDLPVMLRYDNDRLTIAGEQLCEKWTTRGTVFIRVNMD